VDDKTYKEVAPMVEFCKDHKCIKEKLDKIRDDKKFWHRIRDSKWFFWTITGLIMLFIAFNSWVVTEIYAQKADSKQITSIYKDIKEIKEDNKEQDKKREEDKKELSNKLDEQRRRDEEARAKEQRELMKILMDIQKQIKK
jgi:membrane-associated HD superfamily phosphohydrolase